MSKKRVTVRQLRAMLVRIVTHEVLPADWMDEDFFREVLAVCGLEFCFYGEHFGDDHSPGFGVYPSSEMVTFNDCSDSETKTVRVCQACAEEYGREP